MWVTIAWEFGFGLPQIIYPIMAHLSEFLMVTEQKRS